MPQKPLPLIVSLKRWREQNGLSQSDAVKIKEIGLKERGPKGEGSRLNKQQISPDIGATNGESGDGWHGRLDWIRREVGETDKALARKVKTRGENVVGVG